MVEALQQETSNAAGADGHPILMAGVNVCKKVQSIIAEKKLVNSDIYNHPPKKLLEVIRNMGGDMGKSKSRIKMAKIIKAYVADNCDCLPLLEVLGNMGPIKRKAPKRPFIT